MTSDVFIKMTPAQLAELARDAGRAGAEAAVAALSERHSDVLRIVERSGVAKTVMTTREAARYAGVSPSTVRKWIASGMPATPRGGRAGHAIRRDDIDAWRTRSADAA